MSAEHKNRSSSEVTADLLVKRLNPDQLVLLIGQWDYRDFQDRILERLQPISGFGLDHFKKVHPSSKGCSVEEVEIGENIHLHGDTEFGSWGTDVPLQRLRCNSHNVTSKMFFDYRGERQEWP